ncbi:sugar ABC transporter substrate-binding protein [Rhizobium grahamii]|uniref:sugar ABC transporter substrate-binding protein n=1 Tax=Rhizobium grahamii TaxID=1120045 RepID=UPI0011477440
MSSGIDRGKGVVLETRGSVGSAAAQDRHKGCADEMQKHPEITVQSLNTEWIADTAYKMVLDAFTQNPDIKGVFSQQRDYQRRFLRAPADRAIGAAGGRGTCRDCRPRRYAARVGPYPKGRPGCHRGAGSCSNGRRRHLRPDRVELRRHAVQQQDAYAAILDQ